MPFDPTLRQIIASLRSSSEWDEELDLRLLQSLWVQLVGESLAEATAAIAIDDGRVIIRVPNPTWKRQLLSIKPWLIRRMNEPWPNGWITDIGFTYENKRN